MHWYVVFMYNILLTAARNENVSQRYHSKTKISEALPNGMFSAPTIIKLWWQLLGRQFQEINIIMINHVTMVSLVPRLFRLPHAKGTRLSSAMKRLNPTRFHSANHVHDRTQSDNVRYYVTVVALHASAVGDEMAVRTVLLAALVVCCPRSVYTQG